MSDNSVRYKRKRKPLKNANGYPYRLAELILLDHDMTKTWYIKYYVWDIGRHKLVRRRVLKNELADLPDLKSDYDTQRNVLKKNDTLMRGGFQESEERAESEHVEIYNFRGYTLINALDLVIKRKEDFDQSAEGTVKEYKATKTTVLDFMKSASIDKNMRFVKSAFVNRYLE